MNIKELHSIFLASKGISTDTRYIKKGQIFFALKGDNFNGNKYAQTAIESGANYALVDEPDVAKSERFILVENVLKTLQKLAAFHREYLSIPIIGITGTNGKTTTKELLYSVMSKKYNVFATKGNLNNHIGVPLTLLSMNKKTEYGIVEMGASHIGEIAELCEIAKPSFGLITNIASAHLEGFGSLEGVKKAKNELYQYIAKAKGKLFVNAADNTLVELSKYISNVTYGGASNLSCVATKLESNTFLKLEWQNKQISTKLVGDYNLDNVLVSICIGTYFNVDKEDIVKAIEEYQPGNNRSQFLKTKNNKLIVDAYNANPTSLTLAIKNFEQIKADNKLLIIGDMLEIGKYSEFEHKKIMDLVQKLKFEHVYFIGKEFMQFSSKKNNLYQFFDTVYNLNIYLKKECIKNSYILIKGSRGIKLEETIPYL